MLSSFRTKIRSWAMVGVLLFALIAIVVTGFGTGGSGGLGSLSGGGGATGPNLAEVEGQPVTASQVDDMVNRQFAQARQQQPTLDMATFLSQGAFAQTLNQIVVASAIQVFGQRQGLTVSQRMIDREIVNIPAFRNFTGQFDDNSFRAALQSQNLTEARLREDIGRSLMQRQLLGPIALGARTPEGVAREYANLLLERRRGLIGVVPAELLAGGIAPTDAEVARFYQDSRTAFTIPERRVIQYALIGAEQAGQVPPATEAEIAAVYRNSPRSYGAGETRTLQSVVLPTQQAAQAFAARVRGGTSFTDAASQAGFSATDVTFANQRREQFADTTSAEIAAAAFSAAQGAVAGPIRSELGFHVVRVERINVTPGRSLESARAEIAAAIDQRKRENALSALIARIEEQLADGSSFADIARAEHLAIVTTPPVTAVGQPVGGAPWQAPPELAPLLTSAFEMDAEQLEPVVATVEANRRFALLGVDRVEPAAPPPLAQVLPQVRAALVQRRALERAQALAQQIANRINGGMPPAQAFAQAQPRLPAPQSVDLRRLDISRSGQQVPPPLITLFSIPQGRARILPTPNNAGWFIVYHAQRTPGDAATQPALIASTRTEFGNSASEELAQQFARSVELRSQITRNEEAIRTAGQRLGGGAAAAQ
jgi:peptidyl-prolyl cis-trans isomerase D